MSRLLFAGSYLKVMWRILADEKERKNTSNDKIIKLM